MTKRVLAILITILLMVSNMLPTVSAFDIIYDLPPISAKLSEGNKVVTVTFETAPNPGEYITVYSAWDVFKRNERLVIQKIADHNLVQVIRLDNAVQGNVFVSYAPLHTSEGRQIESRVIESTGYTASNQDSSASSSQGKLTTAFEKLPIYDALGNTYALGDTSGELTVLIIGRVNCSLTTGKLRNVKNLLNRLQVEDAEIYLLDLDNTKENVATYAEQNSDIHVAWHNNSHDYNKLFWEIQRAASSVNSNGSATLPSLCILDRYLQPVYYGAGTGIDLSEIESVLSLYGAPESNKPEEKEPGQSGTGHPSTGDTPSGNPTQAGNSDDNELKARLEELGVDVEKALAALKGGGSYSESNAAVSLISPGMSSSASNAVPENVSAEKLHTVFSKLPVYDVVNGEYLLGSTETDLSILVIGNTRCSYTVRRVQYIKDMLKSLNVEHANLYLLDMGKNVGNERADAERFAEKNPGVFVARAADNNDVYYRLFFEVCRTRGKTGGRFPAICILDNECVPVYTTTEILFDENELSNVLRPYSTVPDNMATEGEAPVPPETSVKDTEAHAFGAPFWDVQSNAYYYDAVNWAIGKNITAGTTASTFSPNNTCTHAQIITFLYRAAGAPAVIEENIYTNNRVTSDQYFYYAMLWAHQNGVVTDADLNPNSNCTRSDAVTYLWRLAGRPSVGTSDFADVSASASYAQAVAWAVQQGITAGTSATTFSPNNICTRAQIITFLYRNKAN